MKQQKQKLKQIQTIKFSAFLLPVLDEIASISLAKLAFKAAGTNTWPCSHWQRASQERRTPPSTWWPRAWCPSRPRCSWQPTWAAWPPLSPPISLSASLSSWMQKNSSWFSWQPKQAIENVKANNKRSCTWPGKTHEAGEAFTSLMLGQVMEIILPVRWDLLKNHTDRLHIYRCSGPLASPSFPFDSNFCSRSRSFDFCASVPMLSPKIYWHFIRNIHVVPNQLLGLLCASLQRAKRWGAWKCWKRLLALPSKHILLLILFSNLNCDRPWRTYRMAS